MDWSTSRRLSSQVGSFVLASTSAICDITSIARGPSSRIVVILDDPELKRDLYTALSADEVTLKDWVQECAAKYLASRTQPALPGLSDDTAEPARKSGGNHVV